MSTQPLGPWQAASPFLRPCDRHHGLCAYRTGDPARCPRCHRAWHVITGQDGETREHHEQKHDKDDAKRAAKNARRAKQRATEEIPA